MPHAFLLQDLAVVMVVAAATTALFRLLRLPVVLGYLVAGVLIGPHAPVSFVRDLNSIHTMAELGLVFLMFALGLEFSLPKLARVGVPAIGAGVLEIGVTFGAGLLLASGLGWTGANRVFLGAILSISSTTIIVKILMDMRREKETFAQLVFGLLIVEDVAAVLMLSLLPVLGAGKASSGAAAADALGTLFRIGFFAVFFLVIGLSLVPRLLHWIGGFRSREAVGITSLGLCLAGAMAAAGAGFSVALGAFLVGAVIAASPEADRVEAWSHPIRDMFSALFFVAAGMLINPTSLWVNKNVVLAAAGVVLAGKAFAVGLGILLVGKDLRTALRTGLSMCQIGEFSFVIAGLGVTTGLTGDYLFPVAVGVSSVTTLFTPFLIRHADGAAETVERLAPGRVLRVLDRYRLWVESQVKAGSRAETVILSRYLVRLTLYTVLFAALALVARGASRALLAGPLVGGIWPDVVQGLLWLGVAGIAFPITTAMAKYADHQALLLFTLASPPWLLTQVNIRQLYAFINGTVLLILFSILGVLAAGSFVRMEIFTGTVLVVALAARLFEGPVERGRERWEAFFDEIVGLATSEPTRQAVMRSGQGGHVFRDVTSEVLVSPRCAESGQTLAEMRLRERTGASVVAVYRHGRHIANPGPDARFEAGDVAILLGDAEQRARAAALLNDPSRRFPPEKK